MTWVTQQVLASLAVNADLASSGIARASGVKGRSLENSLLKLSRLGFLVLEDGRYNLTKEGRAFVEAGKPLTSGPRGPQPGKRYFKGTLRERVWRAIRIKKKFSALEIIPLAARGQERDAESNVGKYLRVLARAGFLTTMKTRERGPAPTSPGFLRYLLVRDTGPQAPRWIPRRGCVYDPNTEEEHKL